MALITFLGITFYPLGGHAGGSFYVPDPATNRCSCRAFRLVGGLSRWLEAWTGKSARNRNGLGAHGDLRPHME